MSLFSDRLDGAALNEALVASRLARAGYYVVQSPIYERADFDLLTPDLTVYRIDPILMGKHVYVEVKSMKYLPEDTAIVCSEASFKRKYGVYKTTMQVPYVFVTPEKRMYCVLPGSRVYRNKRIWDSARKSYHRVVKTDASNVVDIEHLEEWLERNL